MLDGKILIALVVLVAIILVAYWAYDTCRLNKHLPAKHQKKCAPAGKGNFVGAMAQRLPLVPCAFPIPAGTGAWQMNRCNYA